MMPTCTALRTALAVLLFFLLAGCAAEQAFREGQLLLDEGQVDAGLAKLEEAVRAEPTNGKYRATLQSSRAELITRALTAAQNARLQGRLDEAEAVYRRVLVLEASNERATSGLEDVARERRYQPLFVQARDALERSLPEAALSILAPVRAEAPAHPDWLRLKRDIDEQFARKQTVDPVLKPLHGKPISIEFKDAPLKHVLEALSRATGINFVLDKDVRADLKTTVFLHKASLEDAVDMLLQTNGLARKVLNRNTALIYPATTEKLKEHQELVVKGFYLANADPKQALTTLKTLLKAKDMVVDEKLNLLIMRDTPEAIRLAEKVLAMQDMSEPEVMLEVEVLEVKRTRLSELGLKTPDSITFTPLNPAGTTAATLGQLQDLTAARIGITSLATTLNLRRETSDVNLLANPRIRARNREKAKVLIGDRVPVITTTSTSTGFVSESVQYLDVGLKLEVEPSILLRDEVAIKVGLEVSSVVREIRSTTGLLSYQIGTRTASTLLQLKDGETQILAGLISDEDRSTASRIPGLGDLPVLGRLFSSQRDDRQKTEIVLSITPRVLRTLNRPDALAGEFWSGTETTLRTRPLTLPLPGPALTSTASAEGTAAPPSSDGASPDVQASERLPETVGVAEPRAIELKWKGPTAVKVGEVFELTLAARSDGGIRSLPLQIAFDPSIVQVLETREGPFFRKAGVENSFSATTDAATGRVFATAGQKNGDGSQGEGVVLHLKMRALATHATDIKVLSAQALSRSMNTLVPVLPPPHPLRIEP